MFRINNNIAALQAHRHLSTSGRDTTRAIEHLSSGLRINKAADDAAGMFVSEQMRAQIAAYKAANRNVAQGVSLLQVMEGGLEQMTGMLTRLKELAIQAADGTYSPAQREKGIQVEADQLFQEMDRIIRGVKFNGITLFVPPPTSITFQVGEYTFDKINFGVVTVDTNTLFGTFALMFNSTGLGSMAYVQMPTIVDSYLTQISSAIDFVVSVRARLGAVQNRLERTGANINIQTENTTNAESVIRDADFAAETSALTRAQILVQAGTAVLNQANLLPQNALNLLGALG
ncbi:flagellin FliC [Candidatus Poribacteria bacterium]|nr:flagellin FliC [Candidatus Poribacteria bacterium]